MRGDAELVALRDTDRRRVVSDERRRIARDLHDVAAHHLSAIVVRAKLADRVATPEALATAVRFTTTTAGDALDSMRHIVAVLATDEAAPLAPAPGLRDLDHDVDTMREAGLHVERSSALDEDVPADIAVASVRIATEALANVLRHRGPGRAWLQVHRTPSTLVVVVDDDGPGTWRPESADPSWYRPGHHGLVGMRERAQACGGDLEISPSPRGGWRVAATLPTP